MLRADRAHFRALTDGAAVIVGRATLADFPGARPLKGRHNIVVTRQNIEIEGAEVVHGTGEAVCAASKFPRCLVIGGESVYRQLLPLCRRVFVTRIAADGGADAFFPPLEDDPRWHLAARSAPMEENGLTFRYEEYTPAD